MCGLLYYFAKNQNLKKKDFKAALIAQNSRGPDSCDMLKYKKSFFGFNLLSIVGSKKISQPYTNYNSIMLFNGEIYNYLELKNEILTKHVNKDLFKKDKSDSKILFEYINLFGIKKTLKIIEGMFSIIFYDKNNDSVYIARDRFGIKPLFVFRDKRKIVAASTIKSLVKLTKNKLLISENKIKNYLKTGAVDTNSSTFFKNITNVLPSSYIKINLRNMKSQISKYWSLVEENKDNFIDTKNKIFEQFLKYKLSRRKFFIPISSGIDSNILQNFYKAKKIINIKSEETKFVNKLYPQGFDLIDLSPSKKINYLRELSNLLDQPIRSSHWILQFAIRKEMKKQKFRVCYLGDGADEIFGGYDYCLKYALNDQKFRINNAKIINKAKKKNFVNNFSGITSLKNYLKKRLFKTHIPYWMRVEDEISMYNSIETRLPYLDHKVVEAMFKNNNLFFFNNNLNKWTLRKIFKNSINKNIFKRRKIGKPSINKEFIISHFKKITCKIQKKKILTYFNFIKKQNLNNVNIDILFRFIFLYYWYDSKKHKIIK